MLHLDSQINLLYSLPHWWGIHCFWMLMIKWINIIVTRTLIGRLFSENDGRPLNFLKKYVNSWPRLDGCPSSGPQMTLSFQLGKMNEVFTGQQRGFQPSDPSLFSSSMIPVSHHCGTTLGKKYIAPHTACISLNGNAWFQQPGAETVCCKFLVSLPLLHFRCLITFLSTSVSSCLCPCFSNPNECLSLDLACKLIWRCLDLSLDLPSTSSNSSSNPARVIFHSLHFQLPMVQC